MSITEVMPVAIDLSNEPSYKIDNGYLVNGTGNNLSRNILDMYPEYVIIKMVFNVPFGMMILFSNVITLVAIHRHSQLKNITNIFIASLTLADLLNAVPVMVIRLLVLMQNAALAHALYMTLFAALILSSSLSIYSHAALALDRLVAIIHPLRYKQIVTKTRAYIITAVIWIFNIITVTILSVYFGKNMEDLQAQIRCILHLPLVLPQEIYYGIILPETILFLFISAVCYCRIFFAIKYRRRYHVTGPHARPRDTEMARSAAMTTAIILMVLIFCWTPFSLLTSLIDLHMFYTRMRYFVLYEISVYVFYTNSFLNPIILYCRNRDFRKAYRDVLCLRPEGESPTIFKNNALCAEGYRLEALPLRSSSSSRSPRTTSCVTPSMSPPKSPTSSTFTSPPRSPPRSPASTTCARTASQSDMVGDHVNCTETITQL